MKGCVITGCEYGRLCIWISRSRLCIWGAVCENQQEQAVCVGDYVYASAGAGCVKEREGTCSGPPSPFPSLCMGSCVYGREGTCPVPPSPLASLNSSLELLERLCVWKAVLVCVWKAVCVWEGGYLPRAP